MSAAITASMLYDLVHCPHRVEKDLFEDPARRDPVSPFVRLLWERGASFERETISNLAVPFLDLSPFSGDEKERRTRESIGRGDSLIYSARIRVDDLVGEPDLLRREGGRYLPGDIKSGAGDEGEEDERKPKKHYAMQLALYVDVLERIGCSAGRRAFVWDVHGQEVPYELDRPQGPKTPQTWWELYLEKLDEARAIVARSQKTKPASISECTLCHWRSPCLERLEIADDLTLITELGRAKRDSMADRVPTIAALASADTSTFVRKKKTVFPGIGPATLAKFQRRARLLAGLEAGPVLTGPVDLPPSERELFFDVEVDPMRDLCYLHGFVERTGGVDGAERYVSFFAEQPTHEAEGRAFSAAWEYARSSRPCAVYHYSPYERTCWRRLQDRYPSVCAPAEVEAFFSDDSTVDLYIDVVKRSTEWPTYDHSIKTLAKHVGFHWRDPDPSGASSIEWYHRWVDTQDREVQQRILQYNEDDCRATRVLLDFLRALASRA